MRRSVMGRRKGRIKGEEILGYGRRMEETIKLCNLLLGA